MIEAPKAQFPPHIYTEQYLVTPSKKWNEISPIKDLEVWIRSASPFYDEGVIRPDFLEILKGFSNPRSNFLDILESFSNLRSNWDGYDALPPFPVILEKVKNLIQVLPDESVLPIDDIFPNSNGTVTIEWLNSNKKCALEIGLSNYSCFLDMQNTDPVYLRGKDILVDIKDFTEKLKQFLG